MPVDWVLVAIALLMVVHLAVLAYVLDRNSAGWDSGETENPQQYFTDDGVTCPSCGETNEPDYRFCRQCVSELPTGVSFLTESSSPQSRRTM